MLHDMTVHEKSRLTLSVPRTEARQKLESQQRKLNEIFGRPVKNNADYELVEAAFRKWDEYTLDLLRSLFENDDVPKEFGAIRHTTVNVGILGDYYQKLRETASRHWRKLDSLIQRLELYAEPETEKAIRRYVQFDESSNNSSSSVTANPQTEGKKNWKDIENEFGIKKTTFAKKINFVSGRFKRTIIFRDVEQAYVLASSGFPKPAVILAGGVIEELLREYLKCKNIQPASDRFEDYIKACESNKLLKKGISRMSDSVRYFRNLVHLSNEKYKKDTISKATAKSAVASIFSIAYDFEGFGRSNGFMPQTVIKPH